MKIFKNKKRKYIIISGLVSAFAIIGLCITYYNSIPKEEPLIGAYIDGNYSETLPTKGSGYAVEKIVCDNNKNASWDYDKWGIKLSNWGTRSRCNIYFKSLESFTLANKTFYLDESQRCPTMNSDGTVTVTGAEDTYGYLCSMKDAYGTSYYYRGNVTNNYVKFGKWSKDTPDVVKGFYSTTSTTYKEYSTVKECQSASSYNVNCTVISKANKDMYWRIMRINGDGTVRVIYDGTSAHANGEASSDRQIGTTVFNNSYNDNAHVGYMYNTNIIDDSTYENNAGGLQDYEFYISKTYSYDDAKGVFNLENPIKINGKNLTNSYVGYYFAEFYKLSTSGFYLKKILKVSNTSSNVNAQYSKGVSIKSESKEMAQTNSRNSTIKTHLDKWYENNIKGTTNEQYVKDNLFCNDRSLSSNMPSGYSNKGYGTENTSYRWSNFADSSYNNKMMLTCPQKNDAFTVRDTSKGNGALTYGIGLVTTDEVVLAGGWSSNNYNYYLNNGNYYWTMSPNAFNGNYAYERNVRSSGYAGSSYVNGTGGARPVLNLSSDVLKNGNGTASDPYHT